MGTPVNSGQSWPQVINRWLNINQVTAITRTRGLLVVPGCILAGPASTTFSDIIGVINFHAGQNFAFDITDPNFSVWIGDNNSNFCLALKNIVVDPITGDVVVLRYKLNSPGLETFYAPMYVDQPLCGANLNLELWSLPGIAYSGVSFLGATLKTSVLSQDTDYRYGVDFQFGTNDNIVTALSVAQQSGSWALPLVWPFYGGANSPIV